MKLSKSIMAMAMVLTSVSALHATDTFYITGSTAYRAATESAIKNIFSTTNSGVLLGFGYDNATYGKNTYSIYHGTINGNDTIIEAAWSGSEAGIQAVAAGLPVQFLDPNNLTHPLTTQGTNTLTSASGLIWATPSACMSDTAQTASQFSPGVAYSVTVSNQLYTGTYSTLVDSGKVGVVPFKFVANATSGLTNMTPQLAKALYSSGKLPKALFTGSSTDETNWVFATGRNPDSGTRLTTVLETKYGTATATVKQYQPVDSSWTVITTTSTTVNALIPWPTDTVNGSVIGAFNSGYNSGGNLAKALANPSYPASINVYKGVTGSSSNGTPLNNGAGTGSGGYTSYQFGGIVGYLSASDADSFIGNGAIELSYNGVTLGKQADYSTCPALLEGAYSFWSYEHLFSANGLTANQSTILADLYANIPTISGVVTLTDMRVVRPTNAADGGLITQKY